MKLWMPDMVGADCVIAEADETYIRTVGRVSDLPVQGVSDSVRGQRRPHPADLEVYPTTGTKMNG